MNKKLTLLLVIFCFCLSKINAQNPVNWTANQLIAPSVLAEKIKSGKNIPVIYSVGPGAIIPGSIEVGMTNDKANLESFKKSLENQPKDAAVVLYCGCCPFEHCPNVRPAIEVLKQMKFTNYQLLDLPHNIRTDWIAKGYPTIK